MKASEESSATSSSSSFSFWVTAASEGRREKRGKEEGEIFPINISMGNITNAALPAASVQDFGIVLGELDVLL